MSDSRGDRKAGAASCNLERLEGKTLFACSTPVFVSATVSINCADLRGACANMLFPTETFFFSAIARIVTLYIPI
jgi:hypothetical protein